MQRPRTCGLSGPIGGPMSCRGPWHELRARRQAGSASSTVASPVSSLVAEAMSSVPVATAPAPPLVSGGMPAFMAEGMPADLGEDEPEVGTPEWAEMYQEAVTRYQEERERLDREAQ